MRRFRQKIGYARHLAGLVAHGDLDLKRLPRDDEEAIAALVGIKGIGRWSAEIYLLFAEGRPDIWPAGDLAVQVEIARILGLDARPTEPQTRALAEPWRPYRGAVALLAWQHYEERARLRRLGIGGRRDRERTGGPVRSRTITLTGPGRGPGR